MPIAEEHMSPSIIYYYKPHKQPRCDSYKQYQSPQFVNLFCRNNNNRLPLQSGILVFISPVFILNKNTKPPIVLA